MGFRAIGASAYGNRKSALVSAVLGHLAASEIGFLEGSRKRNANWAIASESTPATASAISPAAANKNVSADPIPRIELAGRLEIVA